MRSENRTCVSWSMWLVGRNGVQLTAQLQLIFRRLPSPCLFSLTMLKSCNGFLQSSQALRPSAKTANSNTFFPSSHDNSAEEDFLRPRSALCDNTFTLPGGSDSSFFSGNWSKFSILLPETYWPVKRNLIYAVYQKYAKITWCGF